MCVVAIIGCKPKIGEKYITEDHLYLSFVDDNGNDLLDPDTPNSIDCSNVKIYGMFNGEKELMSAWHPAKHYETGWGKYNLFISFMETSYSTQPVEMYCEAWIEWSPEHIDYIKMKILYTSAHNKVALQA